ncbi:MAG: VWA domain-containing protein, partial [Sandaracinaceae bacterium]|nr:VWA domain-containing protein [Sandaracinaceae bacterium]
NLDDLSDLESLLDEGTQAPTAMDAFELFETLYSSADTVERALGELVASFGGAAEMASASATSLALVRALVREKLLAGLGALSPAQVFHACRAGLGEELVREAQTPWELAGFMAGLSAMGLGDRAHLERHTGELGASAPLRDLGNVIRFLVPHGEVAVPVRRAALTRPRDLTEHAELLLGLEDWIDPGRKLVARSAREEPRRAMIAARTLRVRFGHSVEEDVLRAWIADLEGRTPSLRELVDVALDAAEYKKLVPASLEAHVREMRASLTEELASLADEDESEEEQAPVPTSVSAARAAPSAHITEREGARDDEDFDDAEDDDDGHDDGAEANDTGGGSPLPRAIAEALVIARDLSKTEVSPAIGAARALSTETLCLVIEPEHFVPVLDAFLEVAVVPDDLERVVGAARALGLDPNVVYDRIGQALEQLRAMILGGSHDADRYARLVDRVKGIPDEMFDELAACAVEGGNLEAIAALLAVDLGGTAARVPADLVTDALGIKGIGGGTNLLKQWFTHRGRLVDPLRSAIKAAAKEALIDLAFDWLGRGSDHADKGLLPGHQSRPMRPGDDTDLLDLDASLERLAEEGRPLSEAREDDLVVTETVRGEAAISVLIDISGSMSGPDLAMCSIAVVMLLGKLRSDEISLALFESDTHVVKRFADEADLDQIADELLDLHARGGTCADRALRFVAEEMESVEATLRVLFLLSDFAFFEPVPQLEVLGHAIADRGVTLLAASHGYVHQSVHDALLASIGGEKLSMKSVTELPRLLLDVLSRIADGS